MLKKLTTEQQETLLLTAIEEFGRSGPEKASISGIARRSGISVGVIYKYYKNKDALFTACLSHSVAMLKEVIASAAGEAVMLESACEKLIRSCISFTRGNAPYIQMYHAVTHLDGDEAVRYAKEIEAFTADLYTSVLRQAQENGMISRDIDPDYFAYFFDNLLMMLHFDYGCRYYRERHRYYLGDSDDDEEMVKQLMLFLKNALGFRS